jgi:hypothetical protein
MLLSCIVLNEDQSVHLYALMDFSRKIFNIWLLKEGQTFGELTVTKLILITNNSVTCSPQANYSDRATASVGEVSANFFRIEGVTWSAQRIP